VTDCPSVSAPHPLSLRDEVAEFHHTSSRPGVPATINHILEIKCQLRHNKLHSNDVYISYYMSIVYTTCSFAFPKVVDWIAVEVKKDNCRSENEQRTNFKYHLIVWL